MKPRTARWLALLWTLGIIAACLMPDSELPQGTSPSFADKLVHIVMFAGFGGLWMHALSHPLGRRMRRVGGAGVFLAAATEVLQYLLPFGRSSEWLDAGADVVGLALALACYAAYHRLRLSSSRSAERA